MKTILTVSECGNDLFLPLPEPFANALDLTEGDKVNLTVCDNALIISKNTMSYKEHLEKNLIPEEEVRKSLGISDEDLDVIGDVEFE